MSELETAEAFADRIAIARVSHPRKATTLIEARDKAVALRVLTDIRDTANAALKGKALSMSPAEAIANAWQAALDKYQEKP